MLNIADPAQLISYLRSRRLLGGTDLPSVEVLRGGVSCETVLVRNGPPPGLVVKQALPKLRVPVEWTSDPARIHREAAGMRYLFRTCPLGSITPLLLEDEDNHLIVMGEVVPPYSNWKELLLRGEIHDDHVLQFGSLLATIHRSSTNDATEVARMFADRSFFESLRIEPYYLYTASKISDSANFYAELVQDTAKVRVALVHGDYSPKNVLISGERVVLLDHEVVHFGDPAFDVGFSLAHFLSKAHHRRDFRQAFVRAAQLYCNQYRKGIRGVTWETAFEARAVRHALACLLARVAGRSTLEYLTAEEKGRQAQIVLPLMSASPVRLLDLIDLFAERLA